MLKRIQSFIEKNALLPDKDRPVLVGLSGGADSVSLLDILCRLGYSCVALHANFHLRGEESDRDEAFARSFAEQKGVPFYRIDFSTSEYAATTHQSIEMAARQLRYEWFEEMRIKVGAQAIAVAHHKDDSIETLLMNLMRGSGIRGLVGIRPKNGHVVRPLLCVSRAEILAWLKDMQQTYVTDSTNLSDEYTRNYIRLHLIPSMESVNPSVRDSMMRTANHLAAAEEIYLSVVEKARESLWKENRLSIDQLLTYPAPETILYELLHPYGFSRQVVASVFAALEGESGKIFYAPSWRLIKDRRSLLLGKRNMEENVRMEIDKAEIASFANDWPVRLELHPVTDVKIEADPTMAYFDWDRLASPLSLRHWQQGDWFVPFGMQGRKKLSDYFTDHKFTIEQKEQQWLLCSGNKVIWIVGERSDNRYRVTTATKMILAAKKIERND